MRSISDLVKHLVIINVIFFFSTLIFGNIVYDWFALHYFENEKFEYWQLLSHMFMHGNINHILFNMFGLWMFGSPLEKMWGKNKFLFFYISAGLGGAALQMIMYYVQFSSISDQIIQLGYGEDSLNNLLNEGLYDPRILEVINESDLINLIKKT